MTLLNKIWYVLPVEYHRKVVILVLLLLFGMVLETLGVGLVIPLLVLLTDSDFLTKYPLLKPLLYSFGNPSHEQLIIIGMLLMAGVYTFKSIFLGISLWYQTKFT